MVRTPLDDEIHTLQQVELRPIASFLPPPENDEIYQAISWDDPQTIELARSIDKYGIQEPLLVSRDNYIISGNRRYAAAKLAKLVLVPVLVSPVSRAENYNEFLRLLVECNSQRIKSTAVLLRESLIKIDPKAAHQQIVNERKEKDAARHHSGLSVIEPLDEGRRSKISPAKEEFLEATQRVIEGLRDYWPLSDRQVHYRLLGPKRR